MLAFPCPTCEYRLLAHPGKVGKALVCPRCKNGATVPRRESGSSVFDEEPPEQEESSSVLAGLEAMSAGAPATAAPPRRTVSRGPAVPTGPAATPQPPVPSRSMTRAKDAVAFDLPAPSRNNEDLYAQLTTALTMRMNPPPDPPADLRLSTGAWLLATAAGIGLWVLAVLYDLDLVKFVWAVGGLEVAVGIVWVVHRAGRHDPWKGLLALVPPVTLFRLVRRGGPDGYRPLRFVLSGLLVCALTQVARPAQVALRNALGWAPAAAVEPARDTEGSKLRRLNERVASAEVIQKELLRLAKDAPTLDGKDGDELAVELRKLLRHDNADVRAEALRTLVACGKDAARKDVTALLASEYRDDRAAALALLKTWPDKVSAKAAAARLAVDEDRSYARDALVDLGRSKADVEAVLLDALLHPPADDPIPAKPLLDVLELVGGPATVAGLTTFANATADPFLKGLARQKRAAVEERLKKAAKDR